MRSAASRTTHEPKGAFLEPPRPNAVPPYFALERVRVPTFLVRRAVFLAANIATAQLTKVAKMPPLIAKTMPSECGLIMR